MGMHQYLVIFLILFNAEVVYVFLPQDKIISFCNRNIDMELPYGNVFPMLKRMR